MWYLIYAEDVPNSLPLRKQVRPAHLARLQALQDDGADEVAGDDEEDVNAGKTTRQPVRPQVKNDHHQHCGGAQCLDV